MPEVHFYKERSGRIPLLEWVRGQPPDVRVETEHLVELLVTYGHTLGMPHSKPLGDRLHELRGRAGTRQIRILYFFHGPGAVILLLGLLKKQSVIPRDDLVLARRRMQDYLSDPSAHV